MPDLRPLTTPLHLQVGLEHNQMPDPKGECLICKLEAVADAWFRFDQQALDHLLGQYRKDEE